MKSIYSYTDYRLFLRDYLQTRKREPGGYSYARLSTLLEMSSPNYSQLVIEGKRALTLSAAYACADALEFNDDERIYLEQLVLLEELTDSRHRRMIRSRLKSLQKNKPAGTHRTKPGEELENWFTPAVLVFFSEKPTATSIESAASAIGITSQEVEESLRILLQRGLLRKAENGYYERAENVVWVDKKFKNVYQRNYLKSQLERSTKAFETRYDRGAKFYSYTFTSESADAAHFGSRLDAFMESLIVKADHPENGKVFQLNFQVFDLGQ